MGITDSMANTSNTDSMMSSRRKSLCDESWVKRNRSTTDFSCKKLRRDTSTKSTNGSTGSLRQNQMLSSEDKLKLEFDYVRHYYFLIQNADSLKV